MTKDEALKLALSTLNEVRSETFRLLRNGQKLYAEEKVWNTITAIEEALAQPEPVAWGANTIRLTREQLEQIYPPQRKPLTDDEVEKIIKANMSLQMNLAGIRQDFEAAHGIKEMNT